MTTTTNYIIVFDLDDTLYKEIDFLKSAYKEIAYHLTCYCNQPVQDIYLNLINFYTQGFNAFESIIKEYNIKNVSITHLVTIYRNHKPKIHLANDIKAVLNTLKQKAYKVGLITDGRSIQQRNKIEALQLQDYFDDVIISEEFGSEKPSIHNFKYFVDTYGDSFKYAYIGDNTHKDFVSPNRLGWTTICIEDNGEHIHKQSFLNNESALPRYVVKDFTEIEVLLN